MTAIEYNVVATLELRQEHLTDFIADTMIDAVRLYHPAVGPSILGRVEVHLTINAENFNQASDLAHAILEHNLDYDIRSLYVLPTVDYDALGDMMAGGEAGPSAPSLPKLAPKAKPPAAPDKVSVTEAAKLLGLSRQRVQQLIVGEIVEAEKVGNSWAVSVPSLLRYKERTQKKGKTAK